MEYSPEAAPASLLILAQVDHACGDIISSVMEQFSTAGARNVHLVPSLTKKGRPGYLLYIDVPEKCLQAVERLLSVELGVLGWRILQAEHRMAPSSEMEMSVRVTFGEVDELVRVPVKVVSVPDAVLPASIEHDFCVRLQQQLREKQGVHVSLHVLKSSLLAAVAAALAGRHADGTVPDGSLENQQ